jgi:hypothetical protein
LTGVAKSEPLLEQLKGILDAIIEASNWMKVTKILENLRFHSMNDKFGQFATLPRTHSTGSLTSQMSFSKNRLASQSRFRSGSELDPAHFTPKASRALANQSS